MKNDKTIAKAIAKAADFYGSNATLAKHAGIHGATIGHYKNGRISHINDQTWERLYYLIEKYLPDSPRYYPSSKFTKQDEVKEKGNTYSCSENGLPHTIKILNSKWPHLPEAKKTQIKLFIDAVLAEEKNEDCPSTENSEINYRSA